MAKIAFLVPAVVLVMFGTFSFGSDEGPEINTSRGGGSSGSSGGSGNSAGNSTSGTSATQEQINYNQTVTNQQTFGTFDSAQQAAAAAFSGEAVGDNAKVSSTSSNMMQDRILAEMKIQEDLKMGKITAKLAAQRRADLARQSLAGFVSGMLSAGSPQAPLRSASSNSRDSQQANSSGLPIGSGAVDINSPMPNEGLLQSTSSISTRSNLAPVLSESRSGNGEILQSTVLPGVNLSNSTIPPNTGSGVAALNFSDGSSKALSGSESGSGRASQSTFVVSPHASGRGEATTDGESGLSKVDLLKAILDRSRQLAARKSGLPKSDEKAVERGLASFDSDVEGSKELPNSDGRNDTPYSISTVSRILSDPSSAVQLLRQAVRSISGERDSLIEENENYRLFSWFLMCVAAGVVGSLVVVRYRRKSKRTRS
jgi:hypothetical protein